MIETIPLPRDAIAAGDPVDLTVEGMTAWPNQTLTAHLEYNTYRNRFTFWVTHPEFGALFPKSTATIDVEYFAWPYCFFKFLNTGDDATAVTPSTLGTTVELAIFPGPLGGGFLPEAGLSEEEASDLLEKEAWDAN